MKKNNKGLFIYKLKKPDRDIDLDDEQLKRYNFARISDRAIQEFQGVASAIIYDGIVDDNEIELTRQWIEKHREYSGNWPLSELVVLLNGILEDGIVTPEERQQLLDFFYSIAGSTPEDLKVASNVFTENIIPEFKNKTFLFTGKLQFGIRSKAYEEVLKRGGYCVNIYNSRKVDFLVVGKLGQEAWKFSRFGRKIEYCINDINEGITKAAIIREKTFIEAVIRTPL